MVERATTLASAVAENWPKPCRHWPSSASFGPSLSCQYRPIHTHLLSRRSRPSCWADGMGRNPQPSSPPLAPPRGLERRRPRSSGRERRATLSRRGGWRGTGRPPLHPMSRSGLDRRNPSGRRNTGRNKIRPGVQGARNPWDRWGLWGRQPLLRKCLRCVFLGEGGNQTSQRGGPSVFVGGARKDQCPTRATSNHMLRRIRPPLSVMVFATPPLLTPPGNGEALATLFQELSLRAMPIGPMRIGQICENKQ